MGDLPNSQPRDRDRVRVIPPPLTIEREHAMQYFGKPVKIDSKYPEYVKDQIREQIRMNQRIKYLTIALRW